MLLFLCLPQENSVNPDIVEQMYRRNPILRYTQHPLHSPLLPLPYGEVTSCECCSKKPSLSYVYFK